MDIIYTNKNKITMLRGYYKSDVPFVVLSILFKQNQIRIDHQIYPYFYVLLYTLHRIKEFVCMFNHSKPLENIYTYRLHISDKIY